MCASFPINTFAINNPEYVCAYIRGAVYGSNEFNNFSSSFSSYPLFGPDNDVFPWCFNANDRADLQGSPCLWLPSFLSAYMGFLLTTITVLVLTLPENCISLWRWRSLSRWDVCEKTLIWSSILKRVKILRSVTTIWSDKTGTLEWLLWLTPVQVFPVWMNRMRRGS